jgi:hypothetical protein
MNDNPLGLLEYYGPHILSSCIIIYSLFLLYLSDFIENEDDYEN